MKKTLALLLAMLMMLAMYVSAFIFTITPLSNGFYTMVEPLMADPNALTALAADPAAFSELALSIWPVIPIFMVVFVLLVAPFFYGYRMVSYCILNGGRARASMRESVRMMKGHRLELLKLDLSFWWFYLAQGISTVVLYGDVILDTVGVMLPWSADVTYYLFYGLSLVMEGLVYYCCLNRVEVAYATAYNILRPKAQPAQGAVLGNIFDLAKQHNEP